MPTLEETNSSYKLDLYVLENVLQKLKVQADNGLFIVPQSINLSRSDFYSCDIVEEIRRRVDETGIERNRIVIEITESALVDDVEYMTREIKRFKNLGFTVWMDDYGSGYSSPSLLQKIPFDLIKIDMLFVRQLEEEERSRIIVTEIARMGGDEFVVIAQGEYYDNIDILMGMIAKLNHEHHLENQVVVAAGMARHQPGEKVADVFRKADRKMYENKRALKNER
ncbi:EAL domain-containing protein [[Clostridium] aminophilum]|uniref:EAL domain-containing protein n=1 Tax=[Clostridium] aminophilum TaxID=1526 RepID=UPI003F96FA0D